VRLVLFAAGLAIPAAGALLAHADDPPRVATPRLETSTLAPVDARDRGSVMTVGTGPSPGMSTLKSELLARARALRDERLKALAAEAAIVAPSRAAEIDNEKRTILRTLPGTDRSDRQGYPDATEGR
jgi:hypothetical protein